MVQVQGSHNNVTVETPSSDADEDAALWGNVTTAEAGPAGEAKRPRFKFFQDSNFIKRLNTLLKGQDAASKEANVPNEAFELRHSRAVRGDGSGFTGWLQNIQAHLNPKHGAEDT